MKDCGNTVVVVSSPWVVCDKPCSSALDHFKLVDCIVMIRVPDGGTVIKHFYFDAPK